MTYKTKTFGRQYLAGITATITVAAASSCFGWVAPTMKHLTDTTSDIYMTSSQISWMIAIIEVGNLISPIPAGVLADKWGRKPSLLLTGPMCAVSWIVILYTKSYVLICAMRVVQGLSMGIVFTVVPLYLGEISSSEKRGSISGLFSSAWFFGYLIEYCVGPYVSYQIFTAVTATIPIIFFILFLMQPETPYFLLMKGKEEEAESALLWLRAGSSPQNIQNELDEIKMSIQKDFTHTSTVRDVVATPADRRALLIIILIGGVRILSGAIAIMSYSTHLFTQTGSANISPDLLTIIMGLAMFLGGFVNTCIVDSLGRRPLILFSCVGSLFSMFIVGVYFLIESKFTPEIVKYNWIVPLCIILYCVTSVVGIYPVSMTYTSELFTTNTRGIAASISAINLTIGSFICIKVYQFVGDNYGLYTVYFFFTFVCLFGLVAMYMLAPETKGKTFTEIRNELGQVVSKNKVIKVKVNPPERYAVVNDGFI